jgi:hypothetical protein
MVQLLLMLALTARLAVALPAARAELEPIRSTPRVAKPKISFALFMVISLPFLRNSVPVFINRNVM